MLDAIAVERARASSLEEELRGRERALAEALAHARRAGNNQVRQIIIVSPKATIYETDLY